MKYSSRRFHARAGVVLLGACFAAFPAAAQIQNHFTGVNVTGQMVLSTTLIPSQIGQLQPQLRTGVTPFRERTRSRIGDHEMPPGPGRFGHALFERPTFGLEQPMDALAATAPSLTINPTPSGFGFDGIDHADQRSANSGNQFSIEPPSPSIAVANGFVLEGVNNGVQIFTTTGTPVMQTISSNQMFGLPPAIDRTTGIYGPYPTDMRVYFDAGINRWFVLQRSLDNDSARTTLNSSHIYMAVSQTADPRLTWNVYTMDTTNPTNPGCPCVPDYPQIGSDQFGFYISANEYDTTNLQLVDTTILAISKAALGAGSVAPVMERFNIPLLSGYEFAVQPATTPPGASYLLANGGVEYFVSSQAFFSSDSNLGIWAMSNTASLQGTPSLLLTETTAPILTYVYPSIATQPTGPLPYGSTLIPPGHLPYLDGGLDSRVLSVSYAGGRLFATLAAQVTDDLGESVVGGVYAILSPTLRSGTLNAITLKKGYLSVEGNHLLRPAIAVNAQGQGVIAATLVGPGYFPSAAFATIDLTPNTPSSLRVVAAGAFPEDGFSAYPPQPTSPVARWGDYSTAVTSGDGSMWMVTEYIPNRPRTQLANWGTYIAQYVP